MVDCCRYGPGYSLQETHGLELSEASLFLDSVQALYIQFAQ